MPPKDKPKGNDAKVMEEIIVLLFGLYFLALLIQRINDYLHASGKGDVQNVWVRTVLLFFAHIWPIWKIIGAIITVVSFIGIWHSLRGMARVTAQERKIYGPFPDEVLADAKVHPLPTNERWEHVNTLINSPNSSDWRLAIIEADIMLEDMLNTEGYHGESVGDKLKAVDRSDMLTLDQAWEAHKIRNNIAHNSDYSLNERDAKRAIMLYESVFKEFKVI
jgi:hypothetical protein